MNVVPQSGRDQHPTGEVARETVSGFRSNGASDDAAGLAKSESLRAESVDLAEQSGTLKMV